MWWSGKTLHMVRLWYCMLHRHIPSTVLGTFVQYLQVHSGGYVIIQSWDSSTVQNNYQVKSFSSYSHYINIRTHLCAFDCGVDVRG